MTDATALPRWDATVLYPSLGSRQFAAAHEALGADVARLVALYDRHGVGAGTAHAPSAAEVRAFDEVLAVTNAARRAMDELRAFVASYVTTDSRDTEAQGVLSELERHDATMRQLAARFTAWTAALGPAALTAASDQAADHAFALERAGERAGHQMEPQEESLYAELRLTGSRHGIGCTATSPPSWRPRSSCPTATRRCR